MRFNIVNQIFKKELLELIRDKKTLFMMVILPIILYPALMIGGSKVMMMAMDDMSKSSIKVEVIGEKPTEIAEFIKKSPISKGSQSEGKIDVKVDTGDKENIDYIRKNIKEKNVDVYIKTSNSGKDYKIYYDSSDTKATLVKNRIENIFIEYKKELSHDKIQEKGLNPNNVLNPIKYVTESVAEKDEEAGSLIGRMMPFILITVILSGAIYPAIDMIAGEKERGTLETLFTIPITNIELIAGKYLAVSMTAIVSAVLNILSMGFALYFLVASATAVSSTSLIQFNFSAMAIPIIITVIAVLLFTMVISAVSMCICSFAKSYKEAQNYLTPMMLATMIPSYASMLPNLELSTKTAFLPVVNITLLIKYVFSMQTDIGLMAIVLISNAIFVAISLLLLSKIFNSEEILFGGGSNVSILERRSNMKKKDKPTVSDGVLIYIIEVILLLFVGGYLQAKYKQVGLVLSQILMLSVVLIYSWYIKLDIKKAFKFKKINAKKVFYALGMWVVTFIVVMIVSVATMKYIPGGQEYSKKFTEIAMSDNMVVNILVIALTPAICEEILFRGFILSAFSKSKKKENRNENKKSKTFIKLDKNDYIAIMASGILFGIMHIALIKIIPTAILGMAFAVVMKKSDSIYSSMIMHFINNAVSVLATMLAFQLIIR
ncbi:ABC transporter permease subunit/CPBP intramembrane protease [Peptostreptococcus faecalis]|uniref:ABC transporter permease subunit/CPBP intramembrane protease n=1 Tax=Peptostreptococcus faecalis TaxID=2045015 RepID=UPI000C7C08CB|nr:ABC transporter permease subunit/CPBP intramembrane protease [Peptostreptococcus faecalis]